ncbi:potassium-transporting ATPase subunit KdpA [Raoultibacter massiliensis]|uniref:Potassium-transporting ATPase potassium-binding subunit n=1 Tax=Raoultibacter massiliensis TaxID=1852371 RepID=A0ABV1JAB0_9ACTN|nr:potassium-transporting ATPase subunit KdpA [Raoultibacter massiliensis]
MDELLEYGIYLALLVALAIPLSGYINKVMAGEKTLLGRVLVPVEGVVYRMIGVEKRENMGWKRYLVCALAFSAVSLLVLWIILMAQGALPFNPEGLPGQTWDLAFNTAVSFVTNTNWQAYSGESSLSYFSQAIGLTVQNFVTPAVGMAVLFALFRGMVAESSEGLGSFWVDVTRGVLYVFIPLCLVMSIVGIAQGMPENLSEYQEVDLVEPVGIDADGNAVSADDPAAVDIVDKQVVPMGPQASQVMIKQLGTNGGGYNGVNSASPLENPTPLTNIIQCIALLLVPVSLLFSFGRFVNDRKQGRAVFAAVFVLLVVALGIIAFFEQTGTPQLAQNGAVLMGTEGQSGGNMEGKEVRFGVTDSSLWAAFTTAASNGSVNSMHDSYTPIGGMVPMVLMQLGEVIGGGVGCGLYSLIGFVILTVFIAGLMVGRTPEYLGKKIGPKEMRMAVILCITTPFVILVGAAAMSLDPATAASLNNPGAHGFSEVLYTATSTGGNNGSAFAGFNANTPFINVVTGLEMLVNRFVPIAATCVLAGSLASRKKVATTAGTLSTSNAMFVFLLILIILLVGALTMFPALALGPIAEQLQMVL